MNIQITAYGLGSGNGEAAGGGYDDTELRKKIAAVAEQVSKIADTRKEYQAVYITRNDLGSDFDFLTSTTIKFKKPFSKIPFVKVTLDLKTGSAKLIHIANVTKTGFDIATKEPGDLWELQGLWYEAYLID